MQVYLTKICLLQQLQCKTNVYEQEAFVLTYKIYTRESNLQLNNAKLPDFKGFHSQEIEMTTNARWTPEHYKGRNYYTTVYSPIRALSTTVGQTIYRACTVPNDGK